MKDKIKNQIYNLNKQGYSLAEIAKELNISKTTAHRYLQNETNLIENETNLTNENSFLSEIAPKTTFGTDTAVPNRSTMERNGTIWNEMERVNGTKRNEMERNGTPLTCFLEFPLHLHNVDLEIFKGHPKELLFYKDTHKICNQMTALFEEFSLIATPQRQKEINTQLKQLYSTFESKKDALSELIAQLKQKQQDLINEQQERQNNQNKAFIDKIKNDKIEREIAEKNQIETEKQLKTQFKALIKKLQKYNNESKGKKILIILLNEIDEFVNLANFANAFSDEITELLEIKENISDLMHEDKDETHCYLDLDLDELENLLEYL